ncbi:MAG: hypothetical protein P9M08_09485, partial [Candidatus Erginobacter occultus]|nr:hypothetical protein [Candidatus Erginobacter occultus]
NLIRERNFDRPRAAKTSITSRISVISSPGTDFSLFALETPGIQFPDQRAIMPYPTLSDERDYPIETQRTHGKTGIVSPELSGLVQDNREVAGEEGKIPIGRIDREALANRDGANQKIGIRSLDPPGPAEIKQLSRRHVVFGAQGNIREGGQMFFQFFKLRLLSQSREQLLPDGPDNLNPVLQNQVPQFRCHGWICPL